MPKFSTILKKTDLERKRKALKLNVEFKTVLKFAAAKDTFRIHFVYDVHSQTISGKKYRVDIRTSPKLGITENNWKHLATGNISLIANCSCPDFKYRWEAVLWKSQAARKLVSDGSMPDITNPKYKKSFCKHIVAAHKTLNIYVKKTNFSKLGKVHRKK